MDIWDKEPLDDLAKYFLAQFEPNDELPEKVNSFEILRDENLQLTLHTLSDENDLPKRRAIPLGLIYKLDNSIRLNGYIGAGTIHGLYQTNVTTKVHSSAKEIATRSSYKIHRLDYYITENKADFTVDRIANLPDNYIWPEGLSDEVAGTQIRTLSGSPRIEINIKLPGNQRVSRFCARFKIGGHDVVIGKFENSSIPKSKRPGFIYYEGSPNSNTRTKIRASLSFTFGLPLVYLGSCFYKKSGSIVGFEAESPSTVSGRAWDIPSQPLAPITTGRSPILDSALLQKMASSFYDSYELMNLERLLFRFWYAEASPAHMKAAYYGALIESIQKREIERRSTEISSTIIEKTHYRKIIKRLAKYLEMQSIPADSKKLLLAKIQNGNSAPQRIVSERFYNALNLRLGTLELTAWNKRNEAAHGNEEIPDSEIDSIRSTKVLRIILARIILKLLDASEEYIDYYTLDHPFRALGEPIPELEG